MWHKLTAVWRSGPNTEGIEARPAPNLGCMTRSAPNRVPRDSCMSMNDAAQKPPNDATGSGWGIRRRRRRGFIAAAVALAVVAAFMFWLRPSADSVDFSVPEVSPSSFRNTRPDVAYV